MDWIDRYCTSSDLCYEDKNDQHLKQEKDNADQAPDAEQTIKKIEKALANWKRKCNGRKTCNVQTSVVSSSPSMAEERISSTDAQSLKARTVQTPVVSSSPLSPSKAEERIPSTESKPECGTKRKRGKIACASSTSRLPLELLFPQHSQREAQFGSGLPVSQSCSDIHDEEMSAPEETPNAEHGVCERGVELINSQFGDSVTYCKNQLKDACSVSLIDLASRTNSEVESSKCLGEAQFDSSLPIVQKDNFHDEVEHFEFDLAKMKKELGLLDVNSAPLSPIHSPDKTPAMDETRTLTSLASDPITMTCNGNTTTTGDLDFASETNDSLQIKESCTLTSVEGLNSVQRKRPIDSTFSAPLPNRSYPAKRRKAHTFAEGLDNSALDPVKRKRTLKTKDPLQSDSLCVKRQRVGKSICNTHELISSVHQLSGSTDSVSKDSWNAGSDVCQSKDNVSHAPSTSNGLQSSHRTAEFQVNNNNSVHLNLDNAFETPSQCVTEPGVDFSHSVVTAAKNYNIHLGHSINTLGMFKKKQGKNIQEEKNLIESLLDSVNCSTSDDSWTKRAVRSLINLLINPKIIPDKTSLLFQVFLFICSSKENIQFSLHPYEKAILTSLYQVDQMKKLYLTDLSMDFVESLHLIIVNKPDLNFKGLSSFCKMYTEICRERNLEEKPVLLSVDLLKRKPKYAPVMIASIVGVWSEPFQMTEATSDEEKCLLSAVSYGAFGKRKGLFPRLWESCVVVLAQHIIPAPGIDIVEEVIGYLFALIHIECTSESPRDIEQTLLAAVIIFAAFSPWEWTKGNILDEHVVPSLLKYEQLQNERAYGLFSDLYAEVFSFCPGKPENCVLKENFEGTRKGFVKDCAALALIRLLVLQKKAISRTLIDWLQESALNSKGKSLVAFLKSKKLTLNKMLIKEDVLI